MFSVSGMTACDWLLESTAGSSVEESRCGNQRGVPERCRGKTMAIWNRDLAGSPGDGEQVAPRGI